MTLLLGIIFIGGQVYEYYEFIVHSDFTITSGLFGSAFFGLTGLHGLHVSLGAVLLGIVFIRALAGQYSAERHVSVSTASMYWHFVDVVWIFLVVVLYVGANSALADGLAPSLVHTQDRLDVSGSFDVHEYRHGFKLPKDDRRDDDAVEPVGIACPACGNEFETLFSLRGGVQFGDLGRMLSGAD